MRSLILSLLALGVLFSACETRHRKAPPESAGPDMLVTGCYDIVDDSTGIGRRLADGSSPEIYFIDPRPIITVGDYESVEITDQYGPYCLKVDLSKAAAERWAAATKARKGRKLAFIINNELVIAPQVYGEMTGGSFEISGDFKEETLNTYKNWIERDMYE